MTLDELRAEAAVRRKKMYGKAIRLPANRHLGGDCERSEAALDTALAWIDQLVAAGNELNQAFMSQFSHHTLGPSAMESLKTWRTLLKEMGKS